MCLVGEVFDESSDEVCGAVVQNRARGDKLSYGQEIVKPRFIFVE